MKILLTGGAGYVGSAALRHLARNGHEVLAYDNLVEGHPKAVGDNRLVVGDIADTEFLTDTLKEFGADAVMHFAAATNVGESVTRPDYHYGNNVGGTLSLLNAMKAAGVQRMLFSSTCATYGMTERDFMDENTPQDPFSPYARSKLTVEWMIRDFAHAYGMGFTLLRYFNASGADPSGEYGEYHDPETHIIPLVLETALGKRDIIKIFGTDYPTPDGTCIRDYIHVDDLAQAHLRALTHLADGGDSLAVNLGTGQGASVRAVIASVERVTGRKVPVAFEARRPGDPAELTADPRLAEARLGFRARHRDLDRIVADAAPWFAPQSEVACR